MGFYRGVEEGAMNSKLLRAALLMVEATSIPLIVLGFLYLVTGYQLLNPGIQLIPRPRVIHTDAVLRITLVAVSILHGYGGLLLLIARLARSNLLRASLFILVHILLIVFLALVVLLEISLSSFPP
jgi:hypothetical protein